MGATAVQSTPIGDGPLERLAGDNARIRILRYLAEVDGAREQLEIATNVDVSEAMVSRAKHDLLEEELIEETPEGLVATEPVSRAVCSFQEQLTNGRQ